MLKAYIAIIVTMILVGVDLSIMKHTGWLFSILCFCGTIDFILWVAQFRVTD